MTAFDRILNWRLLPGSHKFPGPDGGTCINEAAIVAAGFSYRSIASVVDMPSCFCPVICAYALRLNDDMPDDERKRLLPYVTRLAGTVDGRKVEHERAAALAMRALNITHEEAVRDVLVRSSPIVAATRYALAYHVRHLARWRMRDRTVWDDALRGLDDALAIGNCAPDCNIALVRDRLEAAKQPVPAAFPVR